MKKVQVLMEIMNRYIPFFMCLNCNKIYRADDLIENSINWKLEIINNQQCSNCGQREWMETCPLQTFVKEVNESRCIIPLLVPDTVNKYDRNSWFCIYNGKKEECPIFKIFTGKMKR